MPKFEKTVLHVILGIAVIALFTKLSLDAVIFAAIAVCVYQSK